jgi:hypothetical protein
VRVLRKEAVEVDGDATPAGSILVWNGLVTRMRRASVEAESPSRVDVAARQTLHGRGESRRSGEESEAQAGALL